ncbi:regucalcin-like isoform X1 [Diorhabda carinulata]|uniref:regucalcin-like isoform X1 n=2 Tax=Diorhabda carinulata TaxID=1163345 RepID=UPI0025A0864F|nr:regucalcin-like isoform X1 [Diorhabda carinulata]
MQSKRTVAILLIALYNCRTYNFSVVEKMNPKVELLEDIPSVELGEGPHWDVDTQSLFFVDIFGHSIHKYTPSTKKHSKAIIDLHKTSPDDKYDKINMVSLIVPIKGEKDKFIVSVDRELLIVTWDGIAEKPSNYQKLYEVDNERTELLTNRFNDGKCDPSGRIWAGTMGEERVNGQPVRGRGSLYSFENKTVTKRLGQIGISNGLAWNEELKKMYYIDTFKVCVEEYDFDIRTGNMSNGKPIFDLDKNKIGGFPDGMAIDTDGNLWVAVFNGYKVIKIDPRKPETLLTSIPIPAKQVTSVAFGGANLDELYVTSARFAIDGVVLPPPQHGGVYRVTGLGVKGYPGDAAVL